MKDTRIIPPDHFIPDRSKQRDKIASDTEAFLANGGEIKKIPADYSAPKDKPAGKRHITYTPLRPAQVKSVREKLGLSQAAFAKKIGIRSSTYISELELGIHSTTRELTEKIRGLV